MGGWVCSLSRAKFGLSVFMNLTVFLGRMFVQSDVTLGSVAVSGGDENPDGYATEVTGF